MQPAIRWLPAVALIAACGPRGPAAVRAIEHASYGETRELDQLLRDQQVTIDQTDGERVTLLMHAAAGGRSQAIRVLVARGAALEQTDAQGRTALLHACFADKPGAVMTLIELGANLAATASDGRACRAGNAPQNVVAVLATAPLDPAIRAAVLRQAGEQAGAAPVDEPGGAIRVAADDELTYGAIISIGHGSDNARSGFLPSGYYYGPTDEPGFGSRFHLSITLSDISYGMNGGMRVWRGLTAGFTYDAYHAYKDGATGGLAADELTAGGPGLMVGWLAVQNDRVLVHPYVIAGMSRAGQPMSSDTSYGGRYGVGVLGVVRLFQWSKTFGVSLNARLGYSSFSATPITTTGVDASYSQRVISVGVSPIEVKF